MKGRRYVKLGRMMINETKVKRNSLECKNNVKEQEKEDMKRSKEVLIEDGRDDDKRN